ncbi:LysM peptidoglycan-binding domain-containing protein [uncultured Oscillibacter sp.]|uniref:LysM peptidoglycan-binding domain-containing protein n=1 Tax=uncultured Oscillibacter sp. TaxID=876091 RepID=UPI0025D0E289|nr:LysM peptidoglycan-binding domain-containing protein [uncultured Oscillibacter sp.]
MRLTPMRFKEFTWPHNPEVYTVEYRRRIAVHQAPFGGCVMQELGGAFRVLKGEGVFAGAGAYEQFRRLAAVFREEGPGLLVHPVWQTERAYFASLEAAEEPRPDFVRYRFEFWEDGGGYDGGLREIPAGESSGGQGTAADGGGTERRVHTVTKGETLWGIARRYGVALAALLRANPQIKNPNLIYPGEAVKIP